eukprot:scaffold96075_cov31-Tisochrysis_lutea.AAC.8
MRAKHRRSRLRRLWGRRSCCGKWQARLLRSHERRDAHATHHPTCMRHRAPPAEGDWSGVERAPSVCRRAIASFGP